MPDNPLALTEPNAPAIASPTASAPMALTPRDISSQFLYNPKILDQALALGQTFAKSNVTPKAYRGDPGGITNIILTGYEIGFSPMQALRALYCIDGTVGMKAAAKVALVQSSPKCIFFRLVYSDNEKAVYVAHRRGDPKPYEHTFDVTDAARAQLLDRGDNPHLANWQTYRAGMLRRRASSQLADMKFEDVLFGIATVEDLLEAAGEVIDIPTTPVDTPAIAGPVAELQSGTATVSTAEAKGEPAEPASNEMSDEDKTIALLHERIEAAADWTTLQGVANDMQKQPQVVKDAVRDAYRKQKATLAPKSHKRKA